MQNTEDRSRRTALIARFAVATAILLAAATLAGFGGDFWWVGELLGPFRVQYAWGLAITAVVLASVRHLGWAAFAATFAVGNLALIVPLYLAASTGESPGERSRYAPMRVVVMNVWSQNRRHEEVRRFVAAERPDVLIVLEVTPEWATALEPLREEFPYAEVVPRRSNFGIGLYSRHAFASSEVVLFSEDNPAVVASVMLDEQEVTVIAAHPVPPKTGWHTRARNTQLAELGELAAAQRQPVIVAGDFNMTSWSPRFEPLLKAGGLRDSRRGFGVQASWPAGTGLFKIAIDHCLVSPGVRVRDRRIGPGIGSDHLPVIVDLEIPAG